MAALCSLCRREPVFKLRNSGESHRAYQRRLQRPGYCFWCHWAATMPAALHRERRAA
jgi:hypothetical protein